ncbi:MAG: BamA/TamA family outer membrane protein [Gammaproteobacteria bacterium]
MQNSSPFRLLAPALLALQILFAQPLRAASDPMPPSGQIDMHPETGIVHPRSDWVVAPIPVSNPSIGSGLALTAMLLYKLDEKSPASFTGFGAGYTSSGSWLAGVVEKLYARADLVRVTAGLGYGVLNYDFFGVGDHADAPPIPLRQTVKGAVVDGRMRLLEHLHVGVKWRLGDVNTEIRSDMPPPQVVPDDELDVVISSLGLVASWDTRDRQFAPTRGQFVELTSAFSRKAFGSDLEYETYSLAANAYVSAWKGDVIAGRVYACQASSSAPFFDTCAFGSGVDLRGYEAGQFRDRFLIAAQVEYRHGLSSRFDAVGFAGAGAVAGSFSALKDSELLPDIGVGLRYLAAPRDGVKVSVDFAWGKSSTGFYVYIGDSF